MDRPRVAHRRTVWFLTLLVSFILLPSEPVFGLDPHRALSQFSHEQWATENGLPQNTVHAITQTRDGFIWIATEEGLARFDGINFTVFHKQNTAELRSNDVRALAEDAQGSLWIGTADGLVQFKDGKFQSFSAQGALPSKVIESLYEDHGGNLWVATSAGLSRIKDETLTNFTTQTSFGGSSVQTLFEDSEGKLWIGTARGLWWFNDETFANFAGHSDLAHDGVSAIGQDKEGRLWFGTLAGLICSDHGRFRTYTTRDGLPNDRITAVRGTEGNLWIGTAAGLARFEHDHFAVLNSGDTLSSSIILSMLEDREGSLWIGTESSGLSLLHDKKFTTYTARDGLAGDLVKSIYEDLKDNIWIGTNGGGLSLLKEGKFTTYTTRDGLASNVVLALNGDEDGNLWVGTPDGLNRFKDGKFTTYTSADGLSNDFVRSIYADHHGNLWVGTRGGLNRLKDGVFKIYTMADGLSNDFVGTIYEDAENSLWVGTLGGLSRFKDEKFINYTTKDGLSSDVVISLHETPDGALWIGTNGGGLNRFKDGKFTAYTTHDGLLDDVVYRILEDREGNFWLSSNKGIFRVNKKDLDAFANKKIGSIPSAIYGTADGMLTRECSGGGHPSGWRGRDGKLWFSTIKGVAMIDPEMIKINHQAPPVAIEQVRVDDQLINPNVKTEFPPGKTRFEFVYAGLSFISPEAIRFKYKLEGFDRDWVDGGSRRIASYTNVPAGHYKFMVIAANNDGIWNTTGASFGFYLKPYFYQTYWFYALCAFVMTLLVWQLYRLRLRRVESQFTAVLAERNRIAREIHDNLAQEMLGISMQLEMVARTMPASAEVAKTHLDRVRMLVRHGIAEARRYVWDLRSQALENKDLPAALAETARRLTSDGSVKVQVQVSGAFRALPQSVDGNLLRIAQEAINNAVRHAEAGRIFVNLDFDTRRVRLSVRDDGRGFDHQISTKDDSGHFGLVGMRERAKAMDGRLEIYGGSGEGTEVVVDVPISS
ncbi:MAG TPA: two-component regulator propeller domain-containing protein [Pyrinomonadaceae bacterium]